MPSKSYFSYVRVSTQRQGQHGTSLTEQTGAIDRYAKRWNLQVSKYYEERETAAKTGRPVFLDMLKALRQGKAHGLIVHKIDRSARNLKDWAELGSLIDSGVEVHFANESLDLNSRGGRLSADIQAVVASDYIRNLREETKKGIYGRVKQGLYPFPAPVGYKDMGQGKPKVIDPVLGPLVRDAYERYAAGNIGVASLVDEMYLKGLRNKNGNIISKTAMFDCLRNPFYVGLVRLRSMNEIFIGQHQPIVTKELFDQVQDVLAGKSIKKTTRHSFVYRRHIRCSTCKYLLIAERQKGYVYYRCHTKLCPQRPLREELVTAQFLHILKQIKFSTDEVEFLEAETCRLRGEEPQRLDALKRELKLRSEGITARLERLADGYMDDIFDKETYLSKKNALVVENAEIIEKIKHADQNSAEAAEQLGQFLELAKSAYLSYELADGDERRELLNIVSSNIVADGKTLLFELKKPFDLVFQRSSVQSGGPFRDASRTLTWLFESLLKHFQFGTITKNAGRESA